MKSTMRRRSLTGVLRSDETTRKRIRKYCGLDPDAPTKLQAYNSEENVWPHLRTIFQEPRSYSCTVASIRERNLTLSASGGVSGHVGSCYVWQRLGRTSSAKQRTVQQLSRQLWRLVDDKLWVGNDLAYATSTG